MYSLYRAWFGDNVTSDNYARLQETLSPPDTVVRVGNEGEHQFIAHKGVLAAHSGYLKALLTSAANTPNVASTNADSCTNLPSTAIAVTTTNLSGQSVRQPVTSVSVSSIGGEAFAPLLNYMYTGRLEVTLDNVYSVLLATHLLHMPGALEQCRAALLRLRAPPPLPTPIPVPASPTSTLTSTSTPGSGNILRPIPNRLMIDPGMCWPPATPLYPSTAPATTTIGIPHIPQLQPSVLMPSTVPLNVTVMPTSVQETQSTANYSEVSSPKSSMLQTERNRGARMDHRSKSPKTTPLTTLPFATTDGFTPFTTSNAVTSRASSPSQSVSPTASSTSQSSLAVCQSKRLEQRQVKEENSYDNKSSNNEQLQSLSLPVTSVEETSSTRNQDTDAESVSVSENDRNRSSRRRGRGSNTGNDSSSNGVLSVVYDVACCDGPVKFHRVLNENYSSSASSLVFQSRLQRSCFETENVSSENDENGGPTAVRSCDPIESAIEAANSSESYTCGYCRHTFKSQYCYRKHTKRHLLPTRVNESASNNNNNNNNNRQRQDTARSRREVRLLDLNVQYYPCKICGCKFPSYYFVHKHRKMCHVNTEDRSQEEASNTATEDQGSTTSSSNEKQ